MTLVQRQNCAFVQYVTRIAAEIAAEKTFNKLILAGRRLTIKWGKSQARSGEVLGVESRSYEPVPGLPGTLPAPPQELRDNFFNLAPNLVLPPPVHRPMPPPPPFFFPPQMRMAPVLQPPPPLCPPGTAPPLPPEPPRSTIHYPSQDPNRMGSVQHVQNLHSSKA